MENNMCMKLLKSKILQCYPRNLVLTLPICQENYLFLSTKIQHFEKVKKFQNLLLCCNYFGNQMYQLSLNLKQRKKFQIKFTLFFLEIIANIGLDTINLF